MPVCATLFHAARQLQTFVSSSVSLPFFAWIHPDCVWEFCTVHLSLLWTLSYRTVCRSRCWERRLLWWLDLCPRQWSSVGRVNKLILGRCSWELSRTTRNFPRWEKKQFNYPRSYPILSHNLLNHPGRIVDIHLSYSLRLHVNSPAWWDLRYVVDFSNWSRLWKEWCHKASSIGKNDLAVPYYELV